MARAGLPADNPKAGIRYDAARGVSLYASVGHGGREPGRSDMLQGEDNASLPYSLTAATSCPSDGTDNCIQLRLDAVGYALNDPTNGMFALARQKTIVTNQFRIGLYPFITDIDASYSPLTATISAGSAIDIAAQNRHIDCRVRILIVPKLESDATQSRN